MSLPYAALSAEGDKDKFFEELKYLCDKANEFNMLRIERMKGTKAKVAPILWQYGALAELDAEDTIDHLFYGGNATCSLGFAGLYEAQEVIGDYSKEFGLSVVAFLKEQADRYTEESNISVGLYGTPLEGSCHRLTNALKQKFPSWEFDREYITNSFHLPVFADIGLVEKLEQESEFYLLASSGNVNNTELPCMQGNIAGLEGVVKLAYDKVNYLLLNQPIDKCFECGFRGNFKAGEDGYYCPTCGNSDPETAECIRRVSGYTHDALARKPNKGKYQEQSQRSKHL